MCASVVWTAAEEIPARWLAWASGPPAASAAYMPAGEARAGIDVARGTAPALTCHRRCLAPPPASTVANFYPAMTPSTDSLPTRSVWIRTASLLTSGYVIATLGDITEWVFVSAYDASERDATTLSVAVDQRFHAPEVQNAPRPPRHDLRRVLPPDGCRVGSRPAPVPSTRITILQLWNTVADVFDYYTRGKKLPCGARADYLRLILRFFNHPGTCLDDVTFDALTEGRAKRVVAEMEHFFPTASHQQMRWPP